MVKFMGLTLTFDGIIFFLSVFQFKILSSLHPTPAVCGLPMEEARMLISETGRHIPLYFNNLSNI